MAMAVVSGDEERVYDIIDSIRSELYDIYRYTDSWVRNKSKEIESLICDLERELR